MRVLKRNTLFEEYSGKECKHDFKLDCKCDIQCRNTNKKIVI